MIDTQGRELLERGDALVKRGNIDEAVEQYLRYCEHVESSASFEAREAHLRLAMIRQQVLRLAPERRKVRRALAQNFVGLGLRDDAMRELQRIVEESRAAGDRASEDDALTGLRELADRSVGEP